MTITVDSLRLSVLTLILSSYAISAAPVAIQPTGYTLERVVILSRHGVRSPT